MSAKKHADAKKMDKAAAKAARREEDARAQEAAQELRARREAARGPAPIDNQLHRELPLTRVAYGLLALTVFMFMVARLGVYLANAELEMIASIATTLFFLATFIMWFASRHQAKKLTKERGQGDGAGE